MRYSKICIVILLVILGTTSASVPSVGQLLDRFAANADSYSGSFTIKLESHREVIIQRMEHDFFKPGRRQEHYSLDCRWDGQRVRLWRRSRLGPGTTRIDLGELVTYESTLSDASEQVLYHRANGSEEHTVTYYDQGLARDACFREVEVHVGSWAWGYFPDEAPTRIDGFLRWSPRAGVRPETESINNSECYVLEAETHSGRYTLWLDPAHGYNLAKLHYENPEVTLVLANTLFKEYAGAWIPMETEWEVQLRHPESDMSVSEKTIVVEFEVNPDHEMLRSYALDDIPEGARVRFFSGKGYQMPGEFEWHGGRPSPSVDADTLAQLDRTAEDIAARAIRASSASVGEGIHADTRAKGRSSAPHCGLHCLYLVMKSYGQDPNLVDLMTPDYLDTPNGSTLSALKTAVEDANLHGEIVLRANTRVLKSCSEPAILRVKAGESSRDYDHYILFLGMEGLQARICDPPGLVRLMSLDELSSRWDGNGLVVADRPIELAGVLRAAKARLFLVAGLVVFLMLVIGRGQKRIGWPAVLSTAGGKCATSVMQCGGFAILALGIGSGFHSLSIGGFLRYPDGVTATQRAHVADFIPRIDLLAAKRLQKEGSVFIDARGRRDFDSGHVDGATNVPVDANDITRHNAMKTVSLDDPVVVYCQSEMCQFADVVAGKLRLDGFSNISVLRGGWVEWSTGERPQMRRTNENAESQKWRLNEDGTASAQ